MGLIIQYFHNGISGYWLEFRISPWMRVKLNMKRYSPLLGLFTLGVASDVVVAMVTDMCWQTMGNFFFNDQLRCLKLERVVILQMIVGFKTSQFQGLWLYFEKISGNILFSKCNQDVQVDLVLYQQSTTQLSIPAVMSSGQSWQSWNVWGSWCLDIKSHTINPSSSRLQLTLLF
jgi:hypothetical protein